ncbi:hypothetical protein [Persephonella sp.]
MEKVISTKEFLIELNNLLELAKQKAVKHKIDGKEKELINLAETTEKIFSLYMQKMADMSREELQELLDEVTFLIVRALIHQDEKLKEISKNLKISEDEKELLKLINPNYTLQEYNLLLEKIFRTIVEINPEVYPLYKDSELLNSRITMLIKHNLTPEELEDELLFEKQDLLVFIPFILGNKTFIKHQQEIKKYFGSIFSMPFNYDIIKIGYIIQQVIDYLTYKYPETIIKMLIVPTEGEIPDINFPNVEKLVDLIIENYITIVLNLRRKPKPFISKVSKLSPKIKKYLQENKEILEKTADTLVDNNIFEITTYNENSIEKINLTEEIEALSINENLMRDLFIFGLYQIKEDLEYFILKYSSEDIINLISFVMSSAIEMELDEDLFISLETMKKILSYPYISNRYDYSSLEKAYKTVELATEDDKELLFYKLEYLYLSEKYKDFLEEYKNFADKDDFLEILNVVAKLFTGKLNKQEALEEIKNSKAYNNEYWKTNLDAVICILNNNKKELKKLLNKMDEEEILDTIYIYPYESMLYEELEFEYDYKPKEKEF